MTEEHETESLVKNACETESVQKPESEAEPLKQKADPATRSRRMKITAAVAVVAVCAVIFGAGTASGLFAPGNSLMQTTQKVSQQDDSSQSIASSNQTGQEEAAASQSSQAIATDSDQTSSAASQSEAAAAVDTGTSGSVVGSDAVANTPQDNVSTAAPAQAPATIQVSVYVDASRAKNLGYSSCMADETVTVGDGDSVYDALKATGLSVGGSSNYVRSIGGLAEFQDGSGSGWLYAVDGTRSSTGCGSYVLHGGESIRWIYTLDLGKDI